MPTTRGLERLIFFTDALVAIAITLLVLPIVDAASEVGEHVGSPGDFLAAHATQAFSFVLSFAVIARLWLGHHALFEHVAAYNPLVMLINLLWGFTIVLLPLPTAMTAQWDSGPLVVGFYIGTMAVSSLLLTLLALVIRRNPALENVENPVSVKSLHGSIAATALYFLALVLGVLIPGLNYFALFVLVLLWPIGIWLRHRHAPSADRETVAS